MLNKQTSILIILLSFLLGACMDTEDIKPIVITPTGTINLNLTHKVDGQLLLFDTLKYTNLANNNFSVTRVNYYLSNFKLTTNGVVKYISNQIVYIDARTQPIQIKLDNVPLGTYESLSFNIGIDAANNQHGMIPNTDENIGMIWPEAMGGGYHFLKLEGQFLTPSNDRKGYAVHTGLNAYLINHNPITTSTTVNENQTSTIGLTMNINEWYKNPYTYNLFTDGNYTMGDSTTMMKITNNGKDVFYVE